MSRTTLLVPVRYPLTAPSVQTVERAINCAAHCEDPHLYILHVNLIHRGKTVTRTALQRAVEREAGPLPNASYHVRTSFLLEEAILNEIHHQDADIVFIGASRRARWRRLLTSRLDMTVDLEAFLHEHLHVEVVVT